MQHLGGIDGVVYHLEFVFVELQEREGEMDPMNLSARLWRMRDGPLLRTHPDPGVLNIKHTLCIEC